MVKGVARHAVIVKSPELKDFEQAIFIMSGPGEEPQVKSQSEMLSLACRLAGNYSAPARASKAEGGARAIACALWFFAGCATAAAVLWALGVLPLV